jgi:hypothetical protein
MKKFFVLVLVLTSAGVFAQDDGKENFDLGYEISVAYNRWQATWVYSGTAPKWESLTSEERYYYYGFSIGIAPSLYYLEKALETPYAKRPEQDGACYPIRSAIEDIEETRKAYRAEVEEINSQSITAAFRAGIEAGRNSRHLVTDPYPAIASIPKYVDKRTAREIEIDIFEEKYETLKKIERWWGDYLVLNPKRDKWSREEFWYYSGYIESILVQFVSVIDAALNLPCAKDPERRHLYNRLLSAKQWPVQSFNDSSKAVQESGVKLYIDAFNAGCDEASYYQNQFDLGIFPDFYSIETFYLGWSKSYK